MNNSLIAIESNKLELEESVDLQPQFRKQITELVDIIEALEKVQSSNYWKIIENTIFLDEVETLKNQLSKEDNQITIYRLQGKITQALKYDLNKLIIEKRNQLTNIKKQLHD